VHQITSLQAADQILHIFLGFRVARHSQISDSVMNGMLATISFFPVVHMRVNSDVIFKVFDLIMKEASKRVSNLYRINVNAPNRNIIWNIVVALIFCTFNSFSNAVARFNYHNNFNSFNNFYNFICDYKQSL
jgi:hypothetical protein